MQHSCVWQRTDSTIKSEQLKTSVCAERVRCCVRALELTVCLRLSCVFVRQFPCIIITAKGQPDVATRLFLKKVKETLRIPVLGLFDADPYGLKVSYNDSDAAQGWLVCLFFLSSSAPIRLFSLCLSDSVCVREWLKEHELRLCQSDHS